MIRFIIINFFDIDWLATRVFVMKHQMTYIDIIWIKKPVTHILRCIFCVKSSMHFIENVVIDNAYFKNHFILHVSSLRLYLYRFFSKE